MMVQPQEQARLHAALAALRILARKYEFKDEEERSPLGGVVDATFPLLLPIFQVPIQDSLSAPYVSRRRINFLIVKRACVSSTAA